MSRTAAVIIATLVLLPRAASAQELPTVPIGERVRVSSSELAEPIIGTVVAVDGPRMTIASQQSRSTVSIRRAAITRLQISRGRRSKGHSVGIGIFTGMAIGIVTGLASGDDTSGLIRFTAGEKALMSAGLFSVAGAIIGLTIPSGDRWADLPGSGKLGDTVALPKPALRFSVSF